MEIFRRWCLYVLTLCLFANVLWFAVRLCHFIAGSGSISSALFCPLLPPCSCLTTVFPSHRHVPVSFLCSHLIGMFLHSFVVPAFLSHSCVLVLFLWSCLVSVSHLSMFPCHSSHCYVPVLSAFSHFIPMFLSHSCVPISPLCSHLITVFPSSSQCSMRYIQLDQTYSYVLSQCSNLIGMFPFHSHVIVSFPCSCLITVFSCHHSLPISPQCSHLIGMFPFHSHVIVSCCIFC